MRLAESRQLVPYGFYTFAQLPAGNHKLRIEQEQGLRMYEVLAICLLHVH